MRKGNWAKFLKLYRVDRKYSLIWVHHLGTKRKRIRTFDGDQEEQDILHSIPYIFKQSAKKSIVFKRKKVDS